MCSESVPGAPHRAERGRHRQGVCTHGDHAQEGASRGAPLRLGDLLMEDRRWWHRKELEIF